MDLYQILGVTREATQSEIASRYRKLAMKHHPDRGGDPETFKPIALAYEILSDEEKRKRYDETGEVEQASKERGGFGLVAKCITQVLTEAFESGQDLEKLDILGAIVTHLTRVTNKIIASNQENRRRADKLKKVAVRFTRKGKDKENLLAKLALHPVFEIEQQIKRDEETLEEVKEALTIVKDYQYNFDKSPDGGVRASPSWVQEAMKRGWTFSPGFGAPDFGSSPGASK